MSERKDWRWELAMMLFWLLLIVGAFWYQYHAQNSYAARLERCIEALEAISLPVAGESGDSRIEH